MNSPRSRVGERGQVTIPKKFRHALGIRPGEEVEFEPRDGALIVRRVSDTDPLTPFVGMLSGVVDVDAYLAEARGPAWNAATDTKRPRRVARRRPKRRR